MVLGMSGEGWRGVVRCIGDSLDRDDFDAALSAAQALLALEQDCGEDYFSHLGLDVDGKLLLHRAAIVGRLDLVKLLVERLGASVGREDGSGCNAVFYAIFGGNLEVVQYLYHKVHSAELDGGHVVCGRNHCGRTYLHIAAQYGRVDIADWLVKDQGFQ